MRDQDRERWEQRPRKLGKRYGESWRPETEATGLWDRDQGQGAGWGDPVPPPPPQDTAGAGLPRGHGRREGRRQLEEDKTTQNVSVGDPGPSWVTEWGAGVVEGCCWEPGVREEEAMCHSEGHRLRGQGSGVGGECIGRCQDCGILSPGGSVGARGAQGRALPWRQEDERAEAVALS